MSHPLSPLRRTRRDGFSLVEVVLASSVAMVLVLSFAVSQQVFIDRAEGTLAKEQTLNVSESGVAEIEQAIRMSDAVLTASNGILELSTHYFLDLDADEEKVRFRRQANSIVKEIDTGGGYLLERIVIENVTGFQPHTLEIFDRMPRDVYDPDWVPLSALLEEPVNAVAKLIQDVVPVDPEWDASYASDEQRLEISAQGAATRTTITVSPPTPRTGLEAAARFTPFVDGKQYNALLYGDENDALNQIAMTFESDQTIRLRATEGGVVLGEAVAAFNWTNQDSYTVKLAFVDGRVVASVDRGNGYELIGAVSAGSIDNQPLNFQVNSSEAEGAWDDLSVSYPYTEFKVVVTIDGVSRTIYGGAARRQP